MYPGWILIQASYSREAGRAGCGTSLTVKMRVCFDFVLSWVHGRPWFGRGLAGRGRARHIAARESRAVERPRSSHERSAIFGQIQRAPSTVLLSSGPPVGLARSWEVERNEWAYRDAGTPCAAATAGAAGRKKVDDARSTLATRELSSNVPAS